MLPGPAVDCGGGGIGCWAVQGPYSDEAGFVVGAGAGMSGKKACALGLRAPGD